MIEGGVWEGYKCFLFLLLVALLINNTVYTVYIWVSVSGEIAYVHVHRYMWGFTSVCRIEGVDLIQ